MSDVMQSASANVFIISCSLDWVYMCDRKDGVLLRGPTNGTLFVVAVKPSCTDLAPSLEDKAWCGTRWSGADVGAATCSNDGLETIGRAIRTLHSLASPELSTM